MPDAVGSATPTNNSPGKAGAATPGTEIGNGEAPKAPSEPKRYKFEKLNVGGKEIDFEGDETEVKKRLQQAFGANDTYLEAKRMRQDADAKYSEYQKWKTEQDGHKKKLVTNPIDAAIEAGASPRQVREVAEKWLLAQIQQDEMSPDAKRAMELERELELSRKEKADRDAELENERLEHAAAEERKRIVPEMLKHMDSVGVARTAANLSAIAKRLQVAAQRKQPMTIERAVQLTHGDNQEFVKTTVGGQTKALNEAFKSNNHDAVLKIGKEMSDFLGDETIVALQRYGIVKWKSRAPNMPNQQIVDAAKSKSVETPVEMTRDELKDEWRRRALEIDARRRQGVVT